MSTTNEFKNLFNPWKNEGSPLFASGLNSGPSVLNSNVSVRLAFLRKVYGILSVQLLFTALVSVFIMMSPAIEDFIIRKYVLVFLSS
jgi:hypothetical protein